MMRKTVNQVEKSELRNILGEILKNVPILVTKIQDCLYCSADSSKDSLLEVLRFLWIISISGESLSPSKIVDDAWHELILCTREYERICSLYFTKFIHHSPGGTESENQSKYRKTLTLYALHFGTPPEYFWGKTTEFDTLSRCGLCTTE